MNYKINYKIFKERRQKLLESVKKQYSDTANGTILLIADFENTYAGVFRQESSFYYLTGLDQPACALMIGFDGKETLCVPHYGKEREKWVSSVITADQQTARMYAVDEIAVWGDEMHGYVFPLLFSSEQSALLAEKLKEVIKLSGSIFVLNPSDQHRNIQQKIAFERLCAFAGVGADTGKDISPIVAVMRRVKSKYEVEQMYKAIELTVIAHEGAACAMREGVAECAIQAGVEYVFRESGAGPAFPSVIATGRNSTVLHHTPSMHAIKSGELVIVDIGAEVDHYCADLTRTYPASGHFTKRQREIYSIVLDVQRFIAEHAAPGYWLNNKKYPEKSLHHLAIDFLAKRKYDSYFSHAIGHFLGLDVHDVGDLNEPLREGDVITIEPGLYIPDEKIGVRIEDDYWIIKDGLLCLSENLAKEPDLIEEMAQAQLDFDQDGEGEEDEDFE